MPTATKDKPVPRKKTSKESKDARTIAFRDVSGIADRLDATASALGLDTSNLIRMILTEKLPEYEARVRRSQEQPDA